MTSDDYVKFTLKRSVVSDAGTYCVLARNAYGCDRAFVTVVVRFFFYYLSYFLYRKTVGPDFLSVILYCSVFRFIIVLAGNK